MLRNILLVAVGGAFGSVARYLVSRAVRESFLSAFPYGTLVVNVLGCLALGMASGLLTGETELSRDLRLALTVGFCGGFTTFSTFMNESLSLARTESALASALYVGASVALGFVAVFLGARLIKMI